MPERVEELAPEQAPAARPQAAAPEAATSMPKGPLPGGMSVQQMLSMQQGAGNAAVANFVRGQRRGQHPRVAPSAITAAVAAENPDLAQRNGESPDSAAETAKARAKETPAPAQPAPAASAAGAAGFGASLAVLASGALSAGAPPSCSAISAASAWIACAGAGCAGAGASFARAFAVSAALSGDSPLRCARSGFSAATAAVTAEGSTRASRPRR